MPNIFEKLLDSMHMTDDDDDEDYEEEGELFDDEEDDEEDDRPSRNKSRKAADPVSQPEEEEVKEEVPVRKTRADNIRSIRTPSKSASGRNSGDSMRVCMIKPTSYNDAKEIGDTLLEGRAVVINLEGLHMELAQRIIDFTAGACYAIHGNVQMISKYIFIVTPRTVELSGDFQDIVDLSPESDISSLGFSL